MAGTSEALLQERARRIAEAKARGLIEFLRDEKSGGFIVTASGS